MERIGADFLATGERVGRHGLGAEEMAWLEEKHGVVGRILRPLCDRRGSIIPSLEAWSSLDQMSSDGPMHDEELADVAVRLGLAPENPLGSCGRCKLTVPGFGERVTNLFCEEGFTLNGLRLLDFAYYYKLLFGAKVVLAVDEEEKRELQNLFLPQDLRVYPATPHGPMALVRADWEARSEEERTHILELVACIVATHASAGRCASVPVYYRLESDDETLLVNARALGSLEDLCAIPGVLGMALRDVTPATT